MVISCSIVQYLKYLIYHSVSALKFHNNLITLLHLFTISQILEPYFSTVFVNDSMSPQSAVLKLHVLS